MTMTNRYIEQVSQMIYNSWTTVHNTGWAKLSDTTLHFCL